MAQYQHKRASSCSLIFAGMTNAFVELGAASTDSALDSDLADTDLHDSANEAARGILAMAYSMADALQHGL